jgi:RNA polymerase sigma-70 factor (ECF subfamily)
MADEATRTHERLMTLLAPLHDGARATARRLCRSHADGDDLFQETVLRAFDRLHELRDETKFRSWFFAVMLSVHRARHRRSFWRRFAPLAALTREPARAPESELYEGAQRMARALATLAPEAREALVLFELEGFTLEEVAALQDGSIPAVKSRLSRARARLRRHYQKLEGAERSLVKERRHEIG